MKKYLKLIIITAICVVAFVAIYVIYGYLKDNYTENNTESDRLSDKVITQTDNTNNTNTDAPENITGDAIDNSPAETPEPDYNNFTVYDRYDNATSLSDVVSEGKPTVINFWTTWCGYCKQEMPDFNEVYNEYGDQVNFMMVDINGGGNDDKDKALEYVNENGFDFPVYFDPELSAYTAYTVTAFPATVILDKNGVTYYKRPGAIDKNTLTAMLDDILN